MKSFRLAQKMEISKVLIYISKLVTETTIKRGRYLKDREIMSFFCT